MLLSTSIVNAGELENDLGAAGYLETVKRYEEIFRTIVGSSPGGDVIPAAQDGLIASLPTPSAAVTAALRLHRAVEEESWLAPVQTRAALHAGEVTVDATRSGTPPTLTGPAIVRARQLMSLALPRQILMTELTFDDARQLLTRPEGNGDSDRQLAWREHGKYEFRDSNETLSVFEVGVEGFAPLRPPPGTKNILRAVADADDPTLGWRPATGLEVPGRKGWILQRKLGEGGFGDVWLAQSGKTEERRAFKFCFDPERLRSLKREKALFVILRDALGERSDIAKLLDVQFDEPPFYLESAYSDEGDLEDWIKSRGGIDKIPLETRIDIVARTADAVAAAHSVSVLHKDLKPSNILIYQDEGKPRPRLSDFGLGVLLDPDELGRHDLSIRRSALLTRTESQRGMYSPPETLAGAPFTAAGDVFALGVLLYQLAIGDLTRPLAPGWRTGVADPVLREDIARCVEGDPAKRLANPAVLAQRLRDIDERRRSARLHDRTSLLLKVGSALLAVALAGAGALYFHSGRLTEERDRANREAEAARKITDFLIEVFSYPTPSNSRGEPATAIELVEAAERLLEDPKGYGPDLRTRMMRVIGATYVELRQQERAWNLLTRAHEVALSIYGPDHLEVAGDPEQARGLLSIHGPGTARRRAPRGSTEARGGRPRTV